MAFLFEYRRINDRNMIINFSFETSRIITALGSCSLDKFMSYNDWLIIFENITVFLKQYLSDETNPPEKSSISIPSIQLELIITWQKTRSIHADILSLNLNECFSHYMSIEVKTISKVNEFLLLQKSDLENNVECNNEMDSNRQINHDDDTDNNDVDDDDNDDDNDNHDNDGKYEEYIPEAKHNLPNIKYTPMTNARKNGNYKHDEYIPSTISPDPCGSKFKTINKEYKPSQPVNNKINTKKFDLTLPKVMNDVTRPKRERKMKMDLFGESNEDDDNNDRRKSFVRTSSTRDKHLRSKGSFSNVALKKKKLPSTEMNLKHIAIDELLSSFDQFHFDLNNFFHEYNQQKGSKVKKSKEYDHMTLPTVLLTHDQQCQMMDRLTNAFNVTEDSSMVSKYTRLFWEVMLPEWALRYFMKQFSLTRTDAIEEVNKRDFVPYIDFS